VSSSLLFSACILTKQVEANICARANLAETEVRLFSTVVALDNATVRCWDSVPVSLNGSWGAGVGSWRLVGSLFF